VQVFDNNNNNENNNNTDFKLKWIDLDQNKSIITVTGLSSSYT
jgi:hypothetical protein